MADLSVGGLATGIDTTSLISQLMYLERAPERVLQSKQATMQSQVDIYNQISSLLNSLQTIAAGMNTPTTFMGKTSSVGDSTVVSATATSTATPGSHTIVVTSLAKNQRQVTDAGVADADVTNFNSGSIVINGGASPVTVTIAEGQNSLNGIAAAINGSGANVTASVINDGSANPYRLVITGKDTTNYTLDFSGLATAPASPTGAPYANPTITQSGPTYQTGASASFSVDGVAITKTSNTVTDVIPGVTFTLLKEGGATTSVTVDNDVAGVTKKITDFIGAYNAAMSQINKQSDYNTSTKQGGVLSGDSTLRTVKSQLQSIISTPVTGVNSAFATLAQIGIKTDYTNGTLTLDSTTLSDALSSNFNDVVDLFTHNSGVSGLSQDQYGAAEQYNQVIDRLTHIYEGPTSTANGIISTRIRGLTDSISDINDQIDSMEVLMTQKQNSLKKQYAAMEQLVSGLQGQGNTLLTFLSRNTY
ncbi:flagellar filament capping protein FliD [Geobacter sp.]|uniref:flagellar filament capping protein FliD n=1 Tax=Geobacter sp. TaxID=46610 RepID=UPI002637E359|nr:flagellar filament capping protein FliD [Geobacter sp.]